MTSLMSGVLDAVVELLGVRVDRGSRIVLDGVDLSLPAGRLVAVTGANGSGKSTLLDVLAGLRPPTAGTVRHHATTGRGARPDVAFVPQHTPESASLPLTVRDVVAMGRWAERGPWRPLRRVDRDAVDRRIEELGLTDLRGRRLDTLSGGQRERALVARALAQDSPVLLLDEPTTGLDAESRTRLVQVLRLAAGEGAAVVATTHDEDVAAAADDVLLVRDGGVQPRTSVPGPAPLLAVRDAV